MDEGTAPPPIRVRRRYRSPPYRTGIHVSAESAWIDKVKLRFERSTLFGVQTGGLNPFLNRLAERGFARAGWNTLTIGGPDWLFECVIHFKWQRTPRVNRGATGGEGQGREPGHWRLATDLSFNLTRFISQRGRPSLIDPLEPHLKEIFRATRAQAPRLRTLDRSDNFVPSTDRLGEAQTANWPRELEAFLELFEQLLQRIFQPRAAVEVDPEDYDRTGSRCVVNLDWSDWVVKHIETYWEFHSPDALATVEQFHSLLPRVASDMRASRYALATTPIEAARIGSLVSQEAQAHSSLTLTIPVGNRNASCVVYAKERNRIRFELRRWGNARRTLASAEARRRNSGGGTGGLVRFLEDVANDAAWRMSTFLNTLAATRPADVPSARNLAVLLTHINQACQGNPELTELLLGTLFASGRLAWGQSHPLDNAFRSLLRSGVLVRRSSTITGRSGVLDLAPPYRAYASIVRSLLADGSVSS